MGGQSLLVEAVARACAGAASEAERAVRLHDFVRDSIKFGFTPYFDAACAEQTLRMGTGHCAPKTTLFVALLRQAGFQANAHVVNIKSGVLSGVLDVAPPVIMHSYTDVNVDGKWLKVDSYTVDQPLFEQARARLRAEGRREGYGVHADGTCEWDGRSDAFSQFACPEQQLIQDLGADPGSALRTQGPFGLPLSAVLAPLRLAPAAATSMLSAKAEAVRQGGRRQAGA